MESVKRKMEHAEQIVEAAMRETFEETGLVAKISHVLAIFTSNTHDIDYIHCILYFLAKEYVGEIQISAPAILNVQWMPLTK